MPSLFLALFLLLSILPNANALFFDFTASLRLAEGDVAAPASLIAEARQHMAFASLPYLHSNRLEGCFEDPEKEVCESIKLQGIGDVTWFKPGGGYPSKDAKAYDALIFTWTGDKKKGVERIVLSFKGSDNVQMGKDQAKFKPTAAPRICSVCQVLDAYQNVVASMWPEIRQKLSELIELYPTASVSITGHSAGAAMATIATAFFSKSRHYSDTNWSKFRLFAFASPRVGNEAFVEAMKDFPSAVGQYLVINCADPISNWPDFDDGWRHIARFASNSAKPEQLYMLCPANPAKGFGKSKWTQQVALSCGLTYPWSKKTGGDTCVGKHTKAKGGLLSAAGLARLGLHKTLSYRVGLGDRVSPKDYEKVTKAYTGIFGDQKAKVQKSKGGKLKLDGSRRRRRWEPIEDEDD